MSLSLQATQKDQIQNNIFQDILDLTQKAESNDSIAEEILKNPNYLAFFHSEKSLEFLSLVFDQVKQQNFGNLAKKIITAGDHVLFEALKKSKYYELYKILIENFSTYNQIFLENKWGEIEDTFLKNPEKEKIFLEKIQTLVEFQKLSNADCDKINFIALSIFAGKNNLDFPKKINDLLLKIRAINPNILQEPVKYISFINDLPTLQSTVQTIFEDFFQKNLSQGYLENHFQNWENFTWTLLGHLTKGEKGLLLQFLKTDKSANAYLENQGLLEQLQKRKKESLDLYKQLFTNVLKRIQVKEINDLGKIRNQAI